MLTADLDRLQQQRHKSDAVDKTSSSFSAHGKIGNFMIIFTNHKITMKVPILLHLYLFTGGKGGTVKSPAWQVGLTLCNPTSHVISRSGEMHYSAVLYTGMLARPELSRPRTRQVSQDQGQRHARPRPMPKPRTRK